ncbi:unnamed protein product [Moneuplotes crassus]|uniref:Uncharacterized protein n=1 Tax=Euplotes crassus TaxID=5936 RepID=A0AAD1YAM2_EUPCR|nr:unnamed protein product [Moneuplotes crassus]
MDDSHGLANACFTCLKPELRQCNYNCERTVPRKRFCQDWYQDCHVWQCYRKLLFPS